MLYHKLVAWHDPKSPIAETYRILRTNIQFMSIDSKIKSVLITSSSPNEGKSLTTSNLAISMAQNNNKVIIIDGDLRKPVLHDLFDVSSGPGVTDVLLGQVEITSALQETVVENLRVLTSGQLPPNPAEMVGSARMKQLIREAENIADVVLIDSPPLLPVTDGALLAAGVGGVIIVITRGLTKKNQAIKAKEIINSSQARLLGMVFNKSGTERKGYYYYYYSGKQNNNAPK
ncbi:CpsD/CapB family tyrosine-protein kinase [Desulfoscipio geothermicus]|uniref:non-specific protein-tyrosine kinase n=1 Tax=Desulfoscipio geothermicus DSM 3669 TaxID=1121426 RepID=A0A1I6CZQ7_9FIRM|nr:CpsD/CapB family tyrosine-protein kinase [Desulfoscipio geothermicus]SFQ98715.1 CobQ/CobB/MinD/ParA nucleotide binding domain-containing protein [Desulfoscipio geothermicus DSM 3669]